MNVRRLDDYRARGTAAPESKVALQHLLDSNVEGLAILAIVDGKPQIVFTDSVRSDPGNAALKLCGRLAQLQEDLEAAI